MNHVVVFFSSYFDKVTLRFSGGDSASTDAYLHRTPIPSKATVVHAVDETCAFYVVQKNEQFNVWQECNDLYWDASWPRVGTASRCSHAHISAKEVTEVHLVIASSWHSNLNLGASSVLSSLLRLTENAGRVHVERSLMHLLYLHAIGVSLIIFFTLSPMLV